MKVAFEGQKPLEWIIPWVFHHGAHDETGETEGLGICWLWWTFYFKPRIKGVK